MTTGLNATTFDNLQLGAGVFLTGVDPQQARNADELRLLVAEAIADNTRCLGATRGGGSFECVPEIRHMEADGLRGPCVGATVNDGWRVTLRGTMLAVTAKSFAWALAAADVVVNGQMTEVTPRMDIADTDYLPRLCWAGDTSRGMVLIELHNALNVKGAVLSFTDKGEGTMPFEFVAHSVMGQEEHAPCRVLFFE